MQCACAILSSVACPALQYFSTLSHKWHEFQKELLNVKCVFWFSLQCLSETFLILRRTERDIKKVTWFLYRVPVILLVFQWHLNFLDGFSKNIKTSNFTKIRPVGAELFYTGRRTDRHDEANSLSSQFWKRAPKGNSLSWSLHLSVLKITGNSVTFRTFL